MAITHLEPAAIAVLERALQGPDLELAIRAALIVLNRVYGMPKQPLEQLGGPSVILMSETVWQRVSESNGDPAKSPA